MRVVAGAIKGRRLQGPRGRTTRPTSDRVREALFQVLEPVAGARVLDLYAGSGALGIEALSRGAAEAVFVERDRRAAELIARNLEAVGVAARVEQRDAFAFLEDRRAGRFDLVLIDPPYDFAPTLGDALTERLPRVVTQDSRIVTESDKRAPLELGLPLADERTYGSTRIAIHHAP